MENVLEKIYKAGLKLLEPLTPEETYAIIVKEAIKLINGEDGRVLLDEAGDWKAVYSSSDAIASIKTRKKGYSYKAYKTQKAFVIQRDQSLAAHPDIKDTQIRSVIFIPLSYRNKSIGVLLVRSHLNQSFTVRELDILKLYGSMASLGIRKTQLYSETKQALDTRDLFVSLAAHELRTPLTAVSGYIQLLHSKMKKKDSVEARWAEHAYWECHRLTQLVNELLEINKIRSGKLQYFLEECDIKIIVDRAVSNFKFSHPDREVIVSDGINRPEFIIADFDKLLQVVSNLLDNAAKFSDSETPIELQLKYNDQYCQLRVKDQGIGIAKRDLEKVFSGFYKGDETKKGMGLGLYLAKEVIDRHHGTISIHSRERRGTTMVVRLPVTKHE